MKIKVVFPMIMAVLLAGSFSACKDSKTYAQLLKQEENAINKFLDSYPVAELPADGASFVTTGGKWDDTAAPFYKLADGVYMQVVVAGDLADKAKTGEEIQIQQARRTDLITMTALSEISNDSFRYGSYTYGPGIEKPLQYLGVNSKVRLVVPSKQGTTTEASAVQPVLWDITYRKSIQ